MRRIWFFQRSFFELLSLWLFMLTIATNVCPPFLEARLFCIYFFVLAYPNFVFVTHWFPSAAHELTFATSPQFHFTLHCRSWSSFEVRITMMLILLSRGAKKGGEKKSHFCPRKGRMRFPKGQELQSKSRIMSARTKILEWKGEQFEYKWYCWLIWISLKF